MGIEFPVSVECDKCSKRTTFRVVITKLKPNAEMHLKMVHGWLATSLPESGELLVTCPDCNPMLVSIAPPPLSPSSLADLEEVVEVVGDPATDPTMLAGEVRSKK
jgi:hypothetical protein